MKNYTENYTKINLDTYLILLRDNDILYPYKLKYKFATII